MKPEDWKRIGKWMLFAYLPVVILVIAVFILVQYREHELQKHMGIPVETGTSSPQ